jgi:hypothetical protein
MPSNTGPELQHEIEGILAAMRRAKRRAEDLVIATGTRLVESKDGKVVFVGPEEILARRRKSEGLQPPAVEGGGSAQSHNEPEFERRAERVLPQGEMLTAVLVGIGMGFAGTAAANPDIEETLLAASLEGMERDDLRVLAVLTTWLGEHHQRLDADRLIRMVSQRSEERVQAYWGAIAQWLNRDRRLVKLADFAPKQRIHLLRVGSEFQLKRRGEDPRFAGSGLVVPRGVLRKRDSDVR